MTSSKSHSAIQLDVLGLFLAGLINTFLALLDAGLILRPGTSSGQSDVDLRIAWIAEHTHLWQAGWLFWFAVTLSFSWSYYALGRHLNNYHPWSYLAIGVALVAAAVDIVGVIINLVVLPDLALVLTDASLSADPTLQAVFHSMESLANALTNVAAFGLYSLAGLLLLPAVFTTEDYPRWLTWLGALEWGVAAIATALLIFIPELATAPLLVSFVLYAPWVWGSALWLRQSKSTD